MDFKKLYVIIIGMGIALAFLGYQYVDTNNDLKTIFKQELEDIGITSMVDLKSKKQIIVGVGPFVDKKMAEMIALKIIKSTGKKGEIKRLGN